MCCRACINSYLPLQTPEQRAEKRLPKGIYRIETPPYRTSLRQRHKLTDACRTTSQASSSSSSPQPSRHPGCSPINQSPLSQCSQLPDKRRRRRRRRRGSSAARGGAQGAGGEGLDGLLGELDDVDAVVAVDVEPGAVDEEGQVLRQVEDRGDEGQADEEEEDRVCCPFSRG